MDRIDTQWNSSLYDTKHDFVSKYGEDVLQLLDPMTGEKILDLGCGTGDLADKYIKKVLWYLGQTNLKK